MRISDWSSDVCSSDLLILNEQPDNRDRADANGIERPFARPRERRGRLARTLERAFAKHEDDEAGEHADARETEAITPADPQAEIADEEHAERGADVDANIEDRIGAVAPDVRKPVQLYHHNRNHLLEDARADDDEGERRPAEQGRTNVRPSARKA